MLLKNTLMAGLANRVPIASLIAAVAVAYIAAQSLISGSAAGAQTTSRFVLASISLLGFLVTGLSILVAISNRDLGKQMRASGHYQTLVRDAVSAARFLFASTVVGLLALVVGFLLPYFAAAMAGLLAAGLVYMAAAGSHFFQVLKHL